jgi:hypothetical protein
MAKNGVLQERLQALLRELLLEEVAAGELSIDDIEEAMVELGDAVAREYARLQLAQQTAHPPDHAPCPDCGQACEQAGEREREILTRRGPVPIREAKYYCHKCRRSFFPSGCPAGA